MAEDADSWQLSNIDDSVFNGTLVIAVATHKAYRMPEDPMYFPLQVGKALHPEINLGFQTDDTGNNISSMNASYSELTALYWLWQNCNAKYKGLVHYRRHFATQKNVSFTRTDSIKLLGMKKLVVFWKQQISFFPKDVNIILRRCLLIMSTLCLLNIWKKPGALLGNFSQNTCLLLMK